MKTLSWANVTEWCNAVGTNPDIGKWTDFQLLAEIAKRHGFSIPCNPVFERWNPIRDMNRDGAFTISDIFQWLGYLFHSSGDFLIFLLMGSPELAQFLEISAASYGGFLSGLVSAFIWFAAFAIIGIAQAD